MNSYLQGTTDFDRDSFKCVCVCVFCQPLKHLDVLMLKLLYFALRLVPMHFSRAELKPITVLSVTSIKVCCCQTHYVLI